MSKTYVITSWYFNPIHPGHIECFELAKELGDELRVIVNNDEQAEMKRGVPSFQENEFRMRVVQSIKPVDQVLLCIDNDGSVCESIRKVVTLILENDSNAKFVFAKGWDRFVGNIPEVQVCNELNIDIRDGLGEKTHSSRDYIVLDE